MITFPFTLFAEEQEFTNEYSTTFNGVDETVTMGNPAALDITNNLSIAVWVKTTQTATTSFISKYKTSGNNRQYFVGQTAAGGVWVVMSADGGSSNLKNYSTTETINDGKWHLVVVTFATNVITIYIDGSSKVPVKTVDATVNSLASTTAIVQMSSVDGAPTSFEFAGNLDEVGIWDTTVLNFFDIASLYNQGTPIDLKVNLGAFKYDNADNLVAWWRMGDGDSATTIFDHQGASNGTLNNMDDSNYSTDHPPDWSLNSLLLDGVNEYVVMPDIVPYEVGTQAAFSFWIKGSDFSANQTMFGKGNNAISAYEYFCQILPSGEVYFWVSADGAAFTTLFTSTQISTNTWYHIVCNISGSNLEIYIDGVKDGNTTAFTGTIFNSVEPLYIGARVITSVVARFWDGNLSNFTMFDTSLIQADVDELYNSGEVIDSTTITKAANIIGYWRLGDTPGDVAGAGAGTMIDTNLNANDGDLPNGGSIELDTP